MAKKSRRQTRKPHAQAQAPRPQATPRPVAMGTTPTGSAPALSQTPSRTAAGTAQPAASRTNRPVKLPNNVAAMIESLPSEEAAIPLNRVPYVVSDLKRVAVVALAMLVFIIIAGFITVNITHT